MHHITPASERQGSKRHEHNCAETCVKYVEKLLEAQESPRSSKVASCRFRVFRILKLHSSGPFSKRGRAGYHLPARSPRQKKCSLPGQFGKLFFAIANSIHVLLLLCQVLVVVVVVVVVMMMAMMMAIRIMRIMNLNMMMYDDVVGQGVRE